MSTLNQLLAAHPVAGQRYLDALAEFKAAFVDLAAIELTLMNKNVAGGRQLATFGEYPDLIKFRHPVFAPDYGRDQMSGNWFDAVKVAHTAKVAAYPTPDSEE